jgi:tetratricopeptide (TPR) repeat protein
MNGHISPIGAILRKDPAWALVAFDDSSLFYLKRTELNVGVIASNEYRLVWPGDWSFNGLSSSNAIEGMNEAARAVRYDLKGVFARTAMARACMLAGRMEEAAGYYGALVREQDALAPVWRDYAYCLYVAGHYDEALNTLDTMDRKGLDPAFVCYMRHFYALRQGETTTAQLFLERAVKLEPDEPIYRAACSNLSGGL